MIGKRRGQAQRAQAQLDAYRRHFSERSAPTNGAGAIPSPAPTAAVRAPVATAAPAPQVAPNPLPAPVVVTSTPTASPAVIDRSVEAIVSDIQTRLVAHAVRRSDRSTSPLSTTPRAPIAAPVNPYAHAAAALAMPSQKHEPLAPNPYVVASSFAQELEDGTA